MIIFSHKTNPPSAITYYRLDVPFLGLEQMHDVEITVDDFHPATTSGQRAVAFNDADVMYSHSVHAVQMYQSLEAPQKAIPRWDRYSGKLKFPPIFSLDLDDAYWEVGYMNPAFSFWGIRRPDGTLLEPGDKITIDTMDKGEMTLWEDGGDLGDGKFDFDISKNLQRMQALETLITQAEMMTVSTERLKKMVIEHSGRTKPVVVMPNSIILDHWPMIEMPETKEVTVLWQGGYSHHEDLFEIAESLGRVARRYPRVKFVFFGQMFSWIMSQIPEEQRHYERWVPHETHRLRMATLPHDIALCPLTNTTFNAGKSAIKWYESSVRHTPAATLAKNWGPFGDEIKDGETGLLYNNPEEFEQKLGLLIESAELRRKLGEGAKSWILENKRAKDFIPNLHGHLVEAVAKRAENRAFLQKEVTSNAILSTFESNLGAGKK